jgi:Protein of unknown function (Hypoth_ymh)
VDQALGGDPPLTCINAWSNDTDRSEQRGFANLVKGIFGMFRNTTAHAIAFIQLASIRLRLRANESTPYLMRYVQRASGYFE